MKLMALNYLQIFKVIINFFIYWIFYWIFLVATGELKNKTTVVALGLPNEDSRKKYGK